MAFNDTPRSNTLFADLSLSKRLESAEGFACQQFAQARKRLFPDCESAWMEHAGANVVFDGVDSPTTQTFGLGLFEELTAEALDQVEAFFFERGTAAVHEISPFAGLAALELLCERGYRPIEVSNVLYQPIANSASREIPANITVRQVGVDEAALWGKISARGWTHDHPELEEFVKEMGVLCVARENCPCFLGEVTESSEAEPIPGAAGILCLHQGVALFGGASTVPELRRRGLQTALLEARMRYAQEAGCDLAMMVAEAGSNSQRNAQRQGFQVAYTRIKWRLGK
jgi:GNAT superfamily N-acetyltransferase